MIFISSCHNFQNTALHRRWIQKDPGARKGFQIDQGILGSQQRQANKGDLGCRQYLHQQLGFSNLFREVSFVQSIGDIAGVKYCIACCVPTVSDNND